MEVGSWLGWAVLGILLSAVAASTTEALWRPVAEHLIGTVAVRIYGDDWTGVEVEADSPPPSSQKAENGCPLRDATGTLRLKGHLTVDHWKMFSIGNHVMGLIEEPADNGDINALRSPVK